MEKKAKGKAFNSLQSRRQLWPESSHFQVTQDVRFKGRAIVISIPEMMFCAGATAFGNIDRENGRGIWFATALQLWLHILSTLHARLTSDCVSMADYPVKVYLEALRNEKGAVVEYRLWIFEDYNSNYELSAIFEEAVKSRKKVINYEGYYQDSSNPNEAQENNAGDRSRASEANELQTPDSCLTVLELYKRINSSHKAVDLKWIISHLPRSCSRMNNVHDVFSIQTAIRNTQRNVCHMQRDQRNYHFNNVHDEFLLRKELGLFNITYHYWQLTGDNCFFFKLFPHVQLDENDKVWTKFVIAKAKYLDAEMTRVSIRRELEAKLADKKNARLLVQGVANVMGRPGEGDVAKQPELQPQEDEEEPEEELEEPDHDLYLFDPDPADGNANGAATQVFDPISFEQILETQRQVGLYVDEEETGPADQGDFIDALRVQYENHRHVLTQGYTFALEQEKERLKKEVEGDKITHAVSAARLADKEAHLRKILNGELCSLNMIFAKKYERFCTSYSSETSETMTALYKYKTDHDLYKMIETGEADVFLTDPTLDVFGNWLKYMMEGFHAYEKVTFHMGTCCFIYIAMGNRFVRERGLHIYILLTGDGGVGKTFLVNAVKNNICKETCVDVNSESRQAKAHNVQFLDGLFYQDDSNIGKYGQSTDNQDGELRALMSNCEIIRKVTEMDKQGGRHLVNKKYVFVGCTIDSTNAGESEIIENAKAENKAGMAATVSRYSVSNVNQIKDPLLSVQASNNNDKTSIEFENQVKKFRNKNTLLHIMVAQYWHLTYVGAAPKPCMTIFEIIMQHFIEYLEKMGIYESSNRQIPKIKLFCEQVVVLRTILEMFFVRTGVFHNKPYKVSNLRHMKPIARESDVIFAFTAYFPSFYPRELHTVISIMRKKICSSRDTGDTEVLFLNPYATYEKNKPAVQDPMTAEERAKEKKKALGLLEGDDRSKYEEFKEKKAHKEWTDAEFEKATDALLIHAKKQADAKSADDMSPFTKLLKDARRAGAIIAPSNYNDTNSGTGAGEVLPAQPKISKQRLQDEEDMQLASNPNRKISYVCFRNMTIKKFAEDLHNLSIMETNRPSSTSITHCLQMLSKWRILTHAYQMGEGMPSRTEDKPTHRPGLTEKTPHVYVNYGIIENDSQFEDLCLNAIKHACFKTTLRRRIITLLPHPQYPWLLHVIDLVPTNKPRVYINNKYVSSAQQLILRGYHDPNRLEFNQRFALMNMDMDIDQVALLDFFSHAPVVDDITPRQIISMHPASIQAANREFILRDFHAGQLDSHFACQRYPDDLIEAYKTSNQLLADARGNNAEGHALVGKHSDLLYRFSTALDRKELEYSTRHFERLQLVSSEIPNLYAPDDPSAPKSICDNQQKKLDYEKSKAEVEAYLPNFIDDINAIYASSDPRFAEFNQADAFGHGPGKPPAISRALLLNNAPKRPPVYPSRKLILPVSVPSSPIVPSADPYAPTTEDCDMLNNPDILKASDTKMQQDDDRASMHSAESNRVNKRKHIPKQPPPSPAPSQAKSVLGGDIPEDLDNFNPFKIRRTPAPQTFVNTAAARGHGHVDKKAKTLHRVVESDDEDE